MHTKSQFFQHSSLGLDDLVLEVDVILIQNHWKDRPKRNERNNKSKFTLLENLEKSVIL